MNIRRKQQHDRENVSSCISGTRASPRDTQYQNIFEQLRELKSVETDKKKSQRKEIVVRDSKVRNIDKMILNVTATRPRVLELKSGTCRDSRSDEIYPSNWKRRTG